MLPMWRLVDARGIPAYCALAQHDTGWVILVMRGRDITFAERCSTEAAAVQRTNEIWGVLTEEGWSESRH